MVISDVFEEFSLGFYYGEFYDGYVQLGFWGEIPYIKTILYFR